MLEDFTVLDGPELSERRCCWRRGPGTPSREMSVHELATGARLAGAAGTVPLPGLGSVGGLVSRPEGGHEMWFSYTDHTTLPHVYRFDGRDGSVALFSSPPGAVADVPAVSARQVAYPSKDGTTVRMFVLTRADLVGLDGSPTRPRPAILYGYGGFGVPLTPGYSASILAWVEAGGVYASPTCAAAPRRARPGTGPACSAAKQNVFDDFHAAAETLVAAGLDDGGAARHQRRVERRAPRRRGTHPAARALRGGDVLGAAARHGPVREVRARRDVERRVRIRGRARAAGVAPLLLAVPPRRGRRRTTRRCSSPCSTATPGSIRCTRGRCARRCSTRRRRIAPY